MVLGAGAALKFFGLKYLLSNHRGFETFQREIEASVGGALLSLSDWRVKRSLRESGLVPKTVRLPRCGIDMNYLEREPIPTEAANGMDQPTILLCHSMSGAAEDCWELVSSLDIPPNVRVLVPDQAGHGRDLERVRSVGAENFAQPTQESMLESTSEFLDEVGAGSNCNAFGISMGGGLVYYLRMRRPDVIRRTVLVAPAILPCLDDSFVGDVLDGREKFICFDCRDDVGHLMRHCLSTGREDASRRKKEDPVPRFMLESMYRSYASKIPRGHHRLMMKSLLKAHRLGCDDDMDDGIRGGDGGNPFFSETDVDPQSSRLVIWPEKDVLCDFEKGKRFFRDSAASGDTQFESIPDCGHMFHADGRLITGLVKEPTKKYLLDFSPPPLDERPAVGVSVLAERSRRGAPEASVAIDRKHHKVGRAARGRRRFRPRRAVAAGGAGNFGRDRSRAPQRERRAARKVGLHRSCTSSKIRSCSE